MGGGGTLGSLVEIGTGGLVKSGKTKDKIKEAERAAAEQKAIIDKQKAEVLAEEAKRKKSVLQARQGRRSLLFQGGSELGAEKKTTLGS